MAIKHISVMVNEVMNILNPKDGGVYVDGTFGGGGYSRAILEAASTRVIGIDRDPNAIKLGRELIRRYKGRLAIFEGCFSNMASILETAGIKHVDGIALDLGISSIQVDDPGRGFSFRSDGPLDMRMGNTGLTASDFINSSSEENLANIIFHYGEEKFSRSIAKGIVQARKTKPIVSTLQLADVIYANIHRVKKNRLDPATRTFMALRIYINNELEELERGLIGAEQVLSPGGRLAVVAFHSLEDRMVKSFFRKHSGLQEKTSRHVPRVPSPQQKPSFNLIGRRPIKPSDQEVKLNVRARSARLRAGERTFAPAWSISADS